MAAERIRQQIVALPGVRAVSWGSTAPLALGMSRRHFDIDGYRPAEGEDMEYPYNQVGPDWFEALGITLVRGRGVADGDRRGAAPVVVVNKAFARRFRPGQDPLGKRVRSGTETWSEVVGVARDGRYQSLTAETRLYVFIPALQDRSGTVFHVRTAADPSMIREVVRREVTAVAPDWMVSHVRTMHDQVGLALTPQRVAGAVLSLFGAVALLLAAVGLYGVVAYSVASRSRELGIGLALGATERGVSRLVMCEGALLVVAGVALGVPAGWGVWHLVSALLIDDQAANVMSYLGAAAMLGAIAIVASWIPARRAARLHPMASLRAD